MPTTINPFPGAIQRINGLGKRDLAYDVARLAEESVSVPPVNVTLSRQTSTQPTGRVGSVLARASQYLATNTKNSTFYSLDTRVACASFVSTVLVEEGVLAGPLPASNAGPPAGSEFTRWTPTLETTLISKRAVLITQRNRVNDTAAISLCAPGDIIFWSDGNSRYKHVGIYDRDGFVIATSSSGGHIARYRIKDVGWSHFTSYRLP